jgi:GNAT superfamily N-acetyltransferase
MNITIRNAVLQDLETLKKINLSSFEANVEFDPHIDMAWVYSAHATDYFTDAVTKPDHLALISEIDGVAVGFILLEPKHISYRKVKTIEIGIIAVVPSFRSRGIGATLIDAAKKWARENGYDTLFVNSYIRNDRALEFYKSQGFIPIDESLEIELN